MEIKDIVEQEKYKRTLVKIKKREDALTRKQFLKDCYKMWKDYKKVESPYFWWLGHFHFDRLCVSQDWFYYWLRCVAPRDYIKLDWFNNKWEFSIDWLGQTLIKHKSNPNDEWVYL